jgi:hypothetical protein
MKEIGGYFGLDQLVNNEYHKDLLALNTGRNALLYLLKAKNIQKLYIPYYLCNSVSNMLKKHGFDFEYYHIDADFNPIFNKKLCESEYLYIVNYYGQLTNDKVIHLNQKYGKIILDNTHDFFKKPIDGVDTIYSCRKFFGVPDGAYLSTDSVLDEVIEIDISKDRMTHILGRFEGSASDYYSSFQENDASFNFEPLKFMSKLTKNILGAIDYKKVKEIRDENYAYLESKLKKMNKLRLITPEGAFAYPFYLENGVEIRKKLAAKKIYIPTLWPNVLEDTPESSLEYDYAANILPLPCDQRYGEDEMKYMINKILTSVEVPQ